MMMMMMMRSVRAYPRHFLCSSYTINRRQRRDPRPTQRRPYIRRRTTELIIIIIIIIPPHRPPSRPLAEHRRGRRRPRHAWKVPLFESDRLSESVYFLL